MLANEATFVLPNLRGRGNAGRGSGPSDYRLTNLAADLHDTITHAVDREPYYLAGWSLGVSVALEYLGRHANAQQPSGLILLSGSPALCKTRWFAAHQSQALRDEVAERRYRLGLVEAADDDAAAWTWQAVADTCQLDLLPHLSVPTQVIHGADDEDCPSLHAKWIVQGMPRASLKQFDGVGHTLLSDATADVAAEILDFIAHIERARKSP
ncbi:hypothetical protein PATSB16_23670 [Pandoraea thiooxydans]|nr:hypothetical protein PATSB16_23670 [Pandoraea thiooxydans]